MEKIITCKNRLIGRCRECERNYDPNHHPNNLDCKNYREAVIRILEVKEK